MLSICFIMIEAPPDIKKCALLAFMAAEAVL